MAAVEQRFEEEDEEAPQPGPSGPATPERGFVGRAVSSLRHRKYRLYFISGLGMTASMGIEQLALSWLVLDLTGSLSQLGLVIFARGVPMLLVGLVGGMLADRYNRRNLLVVTQFLTMANLMILAGLTISGQVQIWHVYISSIILGITSSLTAPARQALVRGLVPPEDLMNAVALNSMQQNASRIIWPTVAGVFIAVAGVGATLVLCAMCYVFGIGFLVMIRGLDSVPSVRRGSPLHDIREGMRYCLATPHIAAIMIMSFSVGSFGLAYMQLGAGFARESLGLSAGLTGLFIMASGIGSIIGSTLLLAIDPKNRNTLFVRMALAFATSIFLIAINPNVPLAFILMGAFGVASAALPILANTIFQITVPDRLLGRVVSLWMISAGLGSLSALPLGAVGQAIGLRWALGGVSVILFAVILVVGVFRSPLRKPLPAVVEDDDEGAIAAAAG